MRRVWIITRYGPPWSFIMAWWWSGVPQGPVSQAISESIRCRQRMKEKKKQLKGLTPGRKKTNISPCATFFFFFAVKGKHRRIPERAFWRVSWPYLAVDRPQFFSLSLSGSGHKRTFGCCLYGSLLRLLLDDCRKWRNDSEIVIALFSLCQSALCPSLIEWGHYKSYYGSNRILTICGVESKIKLSTRRDFSLAAFRWHWSKMNVDQCCEKYATRQTQVETKERRRRRRRSH